MRKSVISRIILFAAFAALLVSCDPWEDNTKINDKSLDTAVWEELSSRSELSEFCNILRITGYDSVLLRARTFTVFAPTNTAWETSGIDLTDTLLLRKYVKNTIAYQLYPVTGNSFSVSSIKMINNKNLPVSGNTVENIAVIEDNSNIMTKNGVIHEIPSVLPYRDNIWEYIKSNYSNTLQYKIMNAARDSIMDIDNSQRLYIREDGKVIYDTAWIYTNYWLDNYTVNNEDSAFTVLLLADDATFSTLKSEYEPYYTVKVRYSTEDGFSADSIDVAATDSCSSAEVVRDMICVPVSGDLSVSGDTILSYDRIKVSVPSGGINKAYQASNGKVYILDGVSVKMYQNKIHDIILEGEDYVSTNVKSTVISKRYKTWASQLYDIVLSSRVKYDGKNYYALSTQSTTYYSDLVNSYLAFLPKLNSVNYKVYWKSYDDIREHVDVSLPAPQKLFYSYPNNTALSYKDGVVSHNFSDSIVFIGLDTAGVEKETQLSMYSVPSSNREHMVSSSDNKLVTHVDYIVDQLPCDSYGDASLWVSNNAFATGNYGGSIFLDYIKLVPVIDKNK